MRSVEEKEYWLDYLKIFACILVAIGHLYQSLVTAQVVICSDYYTWFNKTIYYFHVPLFFFCSGYLYQKYTVVNTFNSWWKNIKRKFASLLIPFFIFSTLTWIMKMTFSGAVNSEVDSLFTILFVRPTGQFWYLYCLFFIFAIIPTLTTKTAEYTILVISLVAKMTVCVGGGNRIYIINILFSNLIWFVGGMITYREKQNLEKGAIKRAAIILIAVFLALSFFYRENNLIIDFGVSVIGYLGFIFLFYGFLNKKVLFADCLSQYTFPVYLMHTMMAAAVRALLLKYGCYDAGIHIIAGVIASFIFPIISVEVLKRIKYGLIIIYPLRYMVNFQ